MKYVMEKLPQFLGELYSGVSDYVIDEVALTYDRGDSAKDQVRFWNCDEEPKAAQIDNWARFRIATEKREHPKGEENLLGIGESKGTFDMSPAQRSRESKKGLGQATPARGMTPGGTVVPRPGTAANMKKSGVNFQRMATSTMGKSATKEKSRDLGLGDEFPDFEVKLVAAPEEPKQIVIIDPFEERLRHDRMENDKKNAFLEDLRRQKEEDTRENEKKTKEWLKNLAKKQFTFDYKGDVLLLKPQKGDHHLANNTEQIEVAYNLKLKAQHVQPGYNVTDYKEAEIIEKEGGQPKSLFTKAPDFAQAIESYNALMAEDEANRKGANKKGEPTQLDHFELENGVTIKGAKGQTKTGGPVVLKNRMRIKDWQAADKQMKKREAAKRNKEHKKEIERVSDKDDIKRQVKEVKKQKYKKTVENWKSEIEKGLHTKGVRFDPDLLIKLIMTDEDWVRPGFGNSNVRDPDLDEEKEKLKQTNIFLGKIKKRFEKVMGEPEKYFNRIVAYDPQSFGIRKKPEIRTEQFNQFEKALGDFNTQILGRQAEDNWGGAGGWEPVPSKNQQTDEDDVKMKPIKPEKFESGVTFFPLITKDSTQESHGYPKQSNLRQ